MNYKVKVYSLRNGFFLKKKLTQTVNLNLPLYGLSPITEKLLPQNRIFHPLLDNY